MIDHSTGKGCPLIWTMKGSGNLNRAATQGPRRAPMKPRAVDTMSPPRAPPAIALPTAPQTAAMTMSNKRFGNDITMTVSFRLSIDSGPSAPLVGAGPRARIASTQVRACVAAVCSVVNRRIAVEEIQTGGGYGGETEDVGSDSVVQHDAQQ